jgi:hypothetical protein
MSAVLEILFLIGTFLIESLITVKSGLKNLLLIWQKLQCKSCYSLMINGKVLFHSTNKKHIGTIFHQ